LDCLCILRLCLLLSIFRRMIILCLCLVRRIVIGFKFLQSYFFQTIPMMIIQVTQNSEGSWEIMGFLSFLVSITIFFKNAGQVVIFFSHKIFDNLDVNLLPKEDDNAEVKKDKDAYFSLRNYLNDPDDQMLDDEGNTTLHQATKLEEIEMLKDHASVNPHMLFILNQMGLTPLDVAIIEDKTDRAEILLK
jgi:hypothetical protein